MEIGLEPDSDRIGVPVVGDRTSRQSGPTPRIPAALRRRAISKASTWSFPFVLLLLYEAYLYLEIGWRWKGVGDLHLQFVLGLVLGVICTVQAVHARRQPAVPIRPYVIAMLVTFGVMTGFSIRPEVSVEILWAHVLELALYGFFIASLVTSVKRLQILLVVFLLCFYKMGLEGMIGTITGDMIWENQEIPRLNGPTPIYRHPNSYSGTQLGALAFVFALWPFASRWQRIFLASQLVFIFNIVLRTGSRTGYVACFFLLVTVFLKTRNKARTLFLIVAALLAIGPFVPKDYVERAASVFTPKERQKDDSSIHLRQEIINDALVVFAEHPLGVGVGMFPTIREQRFGRVQDTHNLYLEVATNLGIVGLGVFALFVTALLRTLADVTARCRVLAERLSDPIRAGPEGVDHPSHVSHHTARDAKLVGSIAQATSYFVVTRLYLGLFGHDLYEIYWWFAAGVTTVVWRLAVTFETELIDPAIESRGTRRGNLDEGAPIAHGGSKGTT